MIRFDNKSINIQKEDILAFSCVRNEEVRLPYFLEHHRAIGVDYFFFVDNASNDRTIDILLAEDDVYVYQTDESYAENGYGMDWIHQLLATYGTGHWTLTLDADELFIYPYFEKTDLSKLAEYLETKKADAIESFLLDMYANKPLKDTEYNPGEPFVESCPYFDTDTYQYEKKFFRKKRSMPLRGGPRHRLFWNEFDREKPSPVLRKYPFVKWCDDLYYKTSTHILENVSTADITGVLQHFKLFADFYDDVCSEVKRNEHWDNAAQYKSYWNVMSENPDLNPFFEGSVRYDNSQQLIKLGLMHSSEKFQKFINHTFK